MICHKISSILVLLFVFVGLISCDFRQKYDSYCKGYPIVNSLFKDRNGTLNSMSKLSNDFNYLIFKVKLDQQNGRIVLDKNFTDNEEDYSFKHLYRGYTERFEKDEHLINTAVSGDFTYFYFLQDWKFLVRAKVLRIIKYGPNNEFVEQITKTIYSEPNPYNLTNESNVKQYKEFPFLKIIDTITNETQYLTEIFNSFSHFEYENKIYTLVSTENIESQNQTLNIYNQNSQTGKPKKVNFTIRSMFIQSVDRMADNSLNIMVYLNFDTVFALYKIEYNRQTFQIKYNRKSIYRENKVWLGCPEDLCLNSEINAITLSSDGKLLIFLSRYYYKWNKSEDFPYYHRILRLSPQFRDIDSAFLDPKTSKVFVIKGNSLMEFNDNNYNNKTENVTLVFPGLQQRLKGKVDAIDYDFKSNEIQLFSNNIIVIYKRQSNNSYKYETEKRLGLDLNLPANMDTVFTDENGDQIFVKNNYYFWKEYGIMSIHFIQRYFLCPDRLYMDLGLIDEYQTLKEYEEDSNHQKLSPPERPIDRTYDIPTIAIPTTTTTKTPTYFLPTNYITDDVSKPITSKPLTPIQILILIGFGVFAIILIVGFCLFWSCVYLKSENPEIKRQALRRKLDKIKQTKRKHQR